MNHFLPLLSLCIVSLSALAQAPRSGIALTQFPAWEIASLATHAYPTDSALTFQLDHLNIEVVSAAVQPDGALFVLGALNAGGGYNWSTDTRKDSLVLCGTRFNPDGWPDTIYGSSGWVHYDMPHHESIRNIRAALQSDGKWVVALDFTYQKDIAIMRFNLDGRLDSTFWKAGYVLFTNDPAQTDELKELSVLPDGKIMLIVSSRYETLDSECWITRLNTDGKRDTTFDRDGVLSLAERPWIGACRMLSDGRFVLVSYNQDWLQVERFLPDGRPDLKYGRLGKLHTRIETVNDDFLTLWPDGGLMLQGYESTLCETGQPGQKFRSRRFDATGRPDSVFQSNVQASKQSKGLFLHETTTLLNDSIWLTLDGGGGSGCTLRFYRLDDTLLSSRLLLSNQLIGWNELVLPSPQGGALILNTQNSLLSIVHVRPDGQLNPDYGMDSMALVELGYRLDIIEKPDITQVGLQEINPSPPSPYMVTVTSADNFTIPVYLASKWEFRGTPRPWTCHDIKELVVQGKAEKYLHAWFQKGDFPVQDADWAAVPADRLVGLTLQNCQFSGKAPADLRRFKQLQLLEIYYDSTLTGFQRHLDEALRLISFFPRLQCLVIHAPGLTEMPKSLRKLRNLVYLDLETPQMSHFPDAVLGMQNLRELRLSFRCPNGLPAAIGHLDSLQLLELTGSGPEARLQLPETLGRLQNLKELRLKAGARPSVLPVSVGALRQFEKFEMVNAGISSLPDSLGACTRLKELTIVTSGNFERLPERLLELPNLAKLQLKVCQPEPYMHFQGERLRRLARKRNVWFEIQLY